MYVTKRGLGLGEYVFDFLSCGGAVSCENEVKQDPEVALRCFLVWTEISPDPEGIVRFIHEQSAVEIDSPPCVEKQQQRPRSIKTA